MIKKEFLVCCVNKEKHLNDLTDGSNEKVIFICEDCKNKFERRYRSLISSDIYRCQKCAAKINQNKPELKEKIKNSALGHKRNMKPFAFHVERINNLGYVVLSSENEFIETGEIIVKCKKHNYTFKYNGKKTSCQKCAYEIRAQKKRNNSIQ